LTYIYFIIYFRWKIHRDLPSLARVPEAGSSVNDPASAVNDPASAVNDPASAVNDPASAVNDPASAVNDPASAVNDPAAASASTDSLSVHGLGLSSDDSYCNNNISHMVFTYTWAFKFISKSLALSEKLIVSFIHR
jgi:hypothetical protein